MSGRIDVFISYKREERALSELVKRALITAGYTAVTDLNIGHNEDFGDAIDIMIRTAQLTLVLWTKASAASNWVRKEARLARDLEKAGKRNRYLGVMVEDVDLDLPPDLRGLQMVDIHNIGLDEPGLAQLLGAARDILGAETQQSAQTAEADSEALAEEWQLYDLTRSINVAASYERYLARYPNGEFAEDARRQLGMFTWYLHPFQRGNMSNTLAALGIVGTILATLWGASRDQVIFGVNPDDNAALVSKLDDAAAQIEKLKEERDNAEAQGQRAVEAKAQQEIQQLGEKLNSALAQVAAEQRRRAIYEQAERERLEKEAAAMASAAAIERTDVKEATILGLTFATQNNNGLIVTKVAEDSEAHEKGVRPDDLIIEAGQEKVFSLDDLRARVKDAEEAGRKSLLLLIRIQGDPRFVALELN